MKTTKILTGSEKKLREVFVGVIMIAGLTLFFAPLSIKASAWEQPTQADFTQGTTDNPDLVVTKNQIKLISGVVYEDAEDGDTANWSVHKNTPTGSLTNTFDQSAGSRVINFIGNTNTSYPLFIFWRTHVGFYTLKAKFHPRKNFYLRASVFTANGYHRYLHYIFGQEGKITNKTAYYIYELNDTRDQDGWYTFERDLEKDLQQADPSNKINKLAGLLFSGVDKTDYQYFLPDKSNYLSSILDLGTNKNKLETISWNIDQPTETKVGIRTRTSSDNQNWSEWSTEYSNSGALIASPPNRYIQYRAEFSTNTVSAVPALNKVTLEYNRYPQAPSYLSPENDKILTDQDKLQWHAAADDDAEDTRTYTIELDNNINFQSLDSTNTGVNGTEIQIDQLNNFSNLLDGEKYYWRIKTIDNHNASSDYSTTQSFVLDKNNNAPYAPQSGFNPRESGEVKTLQPTIYWDAATDPDPNDSANKLSYLVQLDDSKKFDSADEFSTTAGTTHLTVPNDLTDNTQYYYHVRTKDDEGATSDWSATQNFIVVTGKNPALAVTKTVGITENKLTSSIFLGSVYSLLEKLKTSPWTISIALAALMIVLSASSSRNLRASAIKLAIAPMKKISVHRHKNPAVCQIDSSFLSPNLERYSHHSPKTTTKVKGGRTTTIITALLLGGAMLAAAAIYYYQNHPSPYKDDGQEISIGDELTYRVDFKNTGDVKATNFNVIDSVPHGTSYVENSATVGGKTQTDDSDTDSFDFATNQLNFKLGEIAPHTNSYVTFKVKTNGVPENRKITNAAKITFDESDGIQTTNETVNYLASDSTMTVTAVGKIKGAVWHDINNDKNKSEQEEGLEKISLRLYQDSNNNQSLEIAEDVLTETTTTNLDGDYQFTSLTTGVYHLQIDELTLPPGSLVTTANNPQTISVDNQEYSGINFGVNSPEDSLIIAEPRGSIGDLVWSDDNANKAKDTTEAGLAGINIKLFEDTNSDDILEENTDLFVTVQKTDSNGHYKFSGLAAKDYLVLADENSLPDQYQLTTTANPQLVTLTSDSQEYETANFGYQISEKDVQEKTTDDGKQTDNDQEEVKTITLLPKSVGGPTVITTTEDAKKPNTVAITPVNTTTKVKKDEVAPPSLTHLGLAEIEDFDKKYSAGLDEDLIFKGRTGANFSVTLFIHSDLNLKTTTTADRDGIWEITVNPRLFEAGEHRVFAQAKDLSGNLSEKVEIARFEVNKEKTAQEKSSTVYWIALLALLIIAGATVAITWIRTSKKR